MILQCLLLSLVFTYFWRFCVCADAPVLVWGEGRCWRDCYNVLPPTEQLQAQWVVTTSDTRLTDNTNFNFQWHSVFLPGGWNAGTKTVIVRWIEGRNYLIKWYSEPQWWHQNTYTFTEIPWLWVSWVNLDIASQSTCCYLWLPLYLWNTRIEANCTKSSPAKNTLYTCHMSEAVCDLCDSVTPWPGWGGVRGVQSLVCHRSDCFE